MGELIHRASGRRMPLAARSIIGRSPACVLQVEVRLASQEHALLVWSGRSWSVRDLDSTNGTYVDGVCLPAGAQRPLAQGAQLAFGAAEDVWILADARAPGAFAIDLGTRRVVTPVDGVLSLTSGQEEVLASVDPQGEILLDRDGEPARAQAPAVIPVGNTSWWVLPPASSPDGTPLASSEYGIEGASFHFKVPRTEERVALTIVFGGASTELAPREHIYLLLVLARARLADRERPAEERGWLHRDKLLSMLRIEESALRVALHRARAQVAEAGLPDAEGLIESRRPFLRRFGSDRIRITTEG